MPGLNALAADRREAAIEQLRRERPDDAAAEMRERGERELLQALARSFDQQGSGHHEFAKLFVERALRLQHDRGTLGYVLPRQWVVLRGWTPLRQWILERGELRVDQLRNAGGWLFEDIHHSYMITLVSSCGSIMGPVSIAAGARNPTDLRAEGWPLLRLSRAEIGTITDSDALPWLNTERDRGVFDSLRKRPRLGSGDGWVTADVDSGRWDFSGSGRDRGYATGTDTDGAWRVLMTRHVKPFGLDTTIAYRRFVNAPGDLAPLSRGLAVDAGEPSLLVTHPLIVVRYASRNDDARTLIAAALPSVGFLFSTGYVHGLDHPQGTSVQEKLALLGYVNSFTADWWARRFVDRHVTKPVLVNLPLPAWSKDEIIEAAALAGTLVARRGVSLLPGGMLVTEADPHRGLEDGDILCRLEHLVLGGFSLRASDLVSILADFSDNGCPPALRQQFVSYAA